MKKNFSVISILIILGVVYLSFTDLKPSVITNKYLKSNTVFSIDKALYHLKKITKKPHYVGTSYHKDVQTYIVSELEKLGFEVETQVETVVNSKNSATTAENIVAKLKGTSSNKALLLLSHYDSNPHSSLGASDAGSGIVTILEGLRAFLATKPVLKNDLIVLISDAEEIGLLGAQAFVNSHPFIKDIGLVLNFEARGSGGPSYMLMETNGKNGKLLHHFLAAKPNFPAANSLMYSVYKKLPNDTDLTVFREDAAINGFNFAFIGDHFDYHSAQDSFSRLDKASLLHQADYLMTTLSYFSGSDLSDFDADEDYVYVNFPFVKMITYPFSWIYPLLITAFLLFLVIVFLGISLNKLTIKDLLKGFIPFTVSLVLCSSITFGLWQLLLQIHTEYNDILHGFTYNGYTYIFAFVFLNLFLITTIYTKIASVEKPVNLLVAPLFFWLLLNVLIALYLKGASFFIIPVFCALIVLLIETLCKLNFAFKTILYTIISIPTIYIFAPLIKMFPVGLGLKVLFISALFMVLVFGLLVLTFHKKNAVFTQKASGFLMIIFFGLATYKSSFSIDNKQPNSLVYIQNSDTQTAYFGTYNTTLDAYTKQVFEGDYEKGGIKNAETRSKYNTRFKYYKKTVSKNIPQATIIHEIDTIIGSKRFLEISIIPNRKVHKVELSTRERLSFSQFKVNDALVHKGKKFTINKGTFLTYHMANTDQEITLSFSVNANEKFRFIINEISYNLLTHPSFNIQQRSPEMMPMPFVTNDAIIISKTLSF